MNCCNTIMICNKQTGNRNIFFMFMVPKPENIVISVLFMLFILFIL